MTENQNFARYSDGKVSKDDCLFAIFRQGIEIYADKIGMIRLTNGYMKIMRVNHDWTKGIGGSFEHKDRDSAVLDCNQKQVLI